MSARLGPADSAERKARSHRCRESIARSARAAGRPVNYETKGPGPVDSVEVGCATPNRATMPSARRRGEDRAQAATRCPHACSLAGPLSKIDNATR